MKQIKNKALLSKEMILPLFWVFFFIASSNGKIQRENTQIKKGKEIDISTSLMRQSLEIKYNFEPFTKAVYLSEF
ncbi:MAG: hypothetical protein M3004_13615 [Bacteroidota bacterium]|nr:hypothetical protein [Bacteroidota bacterium]